MGLSRRKSAAITAAPPQRGRRSVARRKPLKLVLAIPATMGTEVARAPRLPHLESRERNGHLLRTNASTDASAEEVCGLNLMSGCPQQCTFCYARAYAGYPGDEVVYFYAHTADRLRAELRDRRKLPHAVYLCPATDPFPPFAEVQEEACRVMEVLAEAGVETWFMTRGFIRPFALERLARCRDHIKVTIGIATMDNHVRRVMEPLAAPPRLRIKQIAELHRLGVRVQAAVEPLIPGVTATQQNLAPLMEALAGVGVTHVTAGFMFLRPGIRENMKRELGPISWADAILAPYAQSSWLPMGQAAPAQHLPRSIRQSGYSLLMALGAAHGVTVSVAKTTNPDFTPSGETTTPRQMLLA